MADQPSFASLDFAAKKKRTKRDVFLAEMGAVVPWAKLEALVEPHYPKLAPQGGRRPFALSTMLRIYCLQQWYNSQYSRSLLPGITPDASALQRFRTS
jgi:IS5 family transposase